MTAEWITRYNEQRPHEALADVKALRGINPGFALDHMEPMRPVVDRAVLQIIDTVTFTGADSRFSTMASVA